MIARIIHPPSRIVHSERKDAEYFNDGFQVIDVEGRSPKSQWVYSFIDVDESKRLHTKGQRRGEHLRTLVNPKNSSR